MQVHYDEGVANHIGPEPCAGIREDVGEASAGERAGHHDWLIRFLEHRIGDKRIIRLIRKWLKAGIFEDGVVTVADSGTGQGSVISPLLGKLLALRIRSVG